MAPQTQPQFNEVEGNGKLQITSNKKLKMIWISLECTVWFDGVNKKRKLEEINSDSDGIKKRMFDRDSIKRPKDSSTRYEVLKNVRCIQVHRRRRAAPPGRCRSCNRAETSEWRRGPDGARTTLQYLWFTCVSLL